MIVEPPTHVSPKNKICDQRLYTLVLDLVRDHQPRAQRTYIQWGKEGIDDPFALGSPYTLERMLKRRAEYLSGALWEDRVGKSCNGRLGVVYDREDEVVRRCVGVVFDRVGGLEWEGVDGVDGYLWI
jgi:hypothetical protein